MYSGESAYKAQQQEIVMVERDSYTDISNNTMLLVRIIITGIIPVIIINILD